MDKHRLLRLPFSTSGRGEPQFFIFRVMKNGSRPLDLKLQGTDGDVAFLAKLRHNRIGELKASSGHCSDEEWETILTRFLVELDTSQPDIEVKADASSASEVTLNVRKNIQGITQRLGSIAFKKLPEDDDDAQISIFDWCASLLGDQETGVRELAHAQGEAKTLRETVDELKKQQEELIKAKEEDEGVVLEKFKDLLNEKKLKIRQQQLLLAHANPDVETRDEEGIDDAMEDAPRKGKATKKTKRKANVDEESESDNGFDRMDIDEAGGTRRGRSAREQIEEQLTDAEKATTEEDDDLTQSSDNEVAESPAPAPVKTTKSKGAKKTVSGRASKPASKAGARGKKASSAGDDSVKPEDQTPPPRRVLPFQKKKPEPAPAAADDGDTDSDDEL